VKLALTRQHMFDLVGFRTPTIQRMRLGAERDGRLHVVWHDSLEEASTLDEFVEGAAAYSTSMYAGEHRLMTQRLARLDVPLPSWMRAPGETPGSFAAECAMDELAELCGVDPIELRMRNDPPVDPDNGREWASRNLVNCLREGAARFGWSERPGPGGRLVGRWRVGYGMAASTFPAFVVPSTARARYDGDGHYTVGIGATDIGTGARTALVVLAAEALGVTTADVTVEIGDSRLPRATIAGGSMGTMAWGSAVDKVCRALREQVEAGEGPGTELTLDTRDDVKGMAKLSRAAFGAQFAEVRVDTATGEVRVPRMTAVFACGRIVNAETARSQFIGGMTMGVGMALLEEGVPDADFGGFANHDLSSYHIASIADTPVFDVTWLDEVDDRVSRIGAKGIGEIGIVGTAAAVANAVYNATGIRIRDLPITADKLL
jgi:xanthine dehydrogenase YagR molybdenum-binding subunit